jgi:putative alpha-1,2-mannosidase
MRLRLLRASFKPEFKLPEHTIKESQILLKNLFSLLIVAEAHAQKTQVKVVKRRDNVKCVNPFIGASTDGGENGQQYFPGKTYPGATTPFGLVQVSPNTIDGGDNGPGYSYEHTSMGSRWL